MSAKSETATTATGTENDVEADAEKKRMEKLAQMKAHAEQVRIGGKGTQRRKKKVVHKAPAADDKKLQSNLKKLNVQPIQGIEEVNIYKENGEVLHIKNPKVQASLPSSTFAITGNPETKNVSQMGPQLLQELGTENLMKLIQSKALVTGPPSAPPGGQKTIPEEEEVPELVGTFEDASKNEN